MGFLFSPVFWGSVIVLFGLAIILKAVFHIDLPLFRICFGIVLIYIGVRILAGGKMTPGFQSGNQTIFGNGEMKYDGSKREFTTAFANSLVDLKNLEADPQPIHIHTVFGRTVVKMPKGADVKVETSTAFGATVLPGGQMAANFGDSEWRGKNNGKEARAVVQVKTVFGQTVLEE